MATSAIPVIIDALVTQSTTALAAEDVLVIDGLPVTDDPIDMLMVGVDDPQADAPASATSDQDLLSFGGQRDETGTVTLAAYSWNGDANQKTARDGAFGYMAAVETLLRSSPTLGLSASGVQLVQMAGSVSVSQTQGPDGADCLVIFNVKFQAFI